MTLHRAERLSMIGEGCAFLALALGFGNHHPWVTWLWSFGDEPMTEIFFAALLASFGVGSIVIAIDCERRSAIGGALSLAVTSALFAIMIATSATPGITYGLRWHGVVFAAVSVIAAATLRNRQLSRPNQTLPNIKASWRLMLGGFAILTAISAAALLFSGWSVLPWKLSRPSELLIGALLAGLAVEYAYVALSGDRGACQLLLIGMLAYDLIMIGPLLNNWRNVPVSFDLDYSMTVAFVIVTALGSIVGLRMLSDKDLVMHRADLTAST